jgi:hypothetical protein
MTKKVIQARIEEYHSNSSLIRILLVLIMGIFIVIKITMGREIIKF